MEPREAFDQGKTVWNKWRKENPNLDSDPFGIELKGALTYNIKEQKVPDHQGSDFSGVFFYSVDLSGSDRDWPDETCPVFNKSNFRKANIWYSTLFRTQLNDTNFKAASLLHNHCQGLSLNGANFEKAEIKYCSFESGGAAKANFIGTKIIGTTFDGTNLAGADFRGADLSYSDFLDANLEGADLRGAKLNQASFIRTNLEGAILDGANVYGASIWDIKGEIKSQERLEISSGWGDAKITVDDIETAQFIYMMYENEKVRNVINSITSRAVLILGRFSPPERKEVLDSLRVKLREYNLLPIVFDFERPTDKDFTETIKTLAGMSMFVIADITNPKSSPLELQATVPDYQIPFKPIIQAGEYPFAMMVDLQKKYDWVLTTLAYRNKQELMDVLEIGIINPALELHKKLQEKKSQEIVVESAADLLKRAGK